MKFDLGYVSDINLKTDEISDEDSLKNMIFLLSEKKPKINTKKKSEANQYSKNINSNSNYLIQKKTKESISKNKKLYNINNINLIQKEEEVKTKANTNDKHYSIKMNSIKSDINENEQIKNLSNNEINSKNVYYNYNDDYKILNDNSDDKFDSDKFNNNCINKTFEYKNSKKNINKSEKIKLLGKKREKDEIDEKSFKIMNNENIFFDINNLYNNYIGKEKIYKIYENKKGFFEKNITIVEEGIPICIIYFKHEIITKIYLIIEQIIIDKKDEISEILTEIKKNIQIMHESNGF